MESTSLVELLGDLLQLALLPGDRPKEDSDSDLSHFATKYD